MNSDENEVSATPQFDSINGGAAPTQNLSPPKAVVYSCSGCSDAGELADRAARCLARGGAAEMSCLAGIGGRVKSLVRKARSAEKILAIDGCPLNCASNTLELAGFNDFVHLELHKLGLRKGSCPPTPERIAVVAEAALKAIGATSTARPISEPGMG